MKSDAEYILYLKTAQPCSKHVQGRLCLLVHEEKNREEIKDRRERGKGKRNVMNDINDFDHKEAAKKALCQPNVT